MVDESKTSINWLYQYYWLRANLMRERFYEKFNRGSEHNFNEHFFVSHQFTYMSFWYASLYSVVEGYEKLQLDDNSINQLLASSNLETLRKFRHSVTGFHKDYYNSNLVIPLLTSTTAVSWVNHLHFSLGKYLTAEISKN